MFRIFTLSLLFLFLLSCSSESKISNVDVKESYSISYSTDVYIDSTFSLTLVNNSLDSLIVFSPSLKKIEKYENNKWRKVKILHCPCNANCIKPPSQKRLGKGEKYKINWNLIESWCGEKDKQGIKPLFEEKSTLGLYRAKIIKNS